MSTSPSKNSTRTPPTPLNKPEGVRVLTLIDGFNFLYRAYYALQAQGKDFRAPDGTPTGAFLTFVSMVTQAKTLSQADALAIVFESKTPTFRDQLFTDYKKNRPETPDDIKTQLKLVERIFPLMGVPVLSINGLEADDVLGSYAQATPAEWLTVMATADKDLAQNVSDQAYMLNPGTWQFLTPEVVAQQFGVPPSLIAQFLALQGDSVDNIPGVDKCGPKTAAKLLHQHGSIDAIYEHLETLTPVLRQNFEKAQPQMKDLLELTTVRTHPIPMAFEEIQRFNHQPDWKSAHAIIQPLGLKKLTERAEKGMAAQERQTQQRALLNPEASLTDSAPEITTPKKNHP